MINAKDFVEAARSFDFEWYCGVPCSYLTPFINYVINDSSLTYISSANEGDAVATASGATIGGKRAIAMMQNSGLGNAVSPLTSLSYVFRIPILIICTHRGQPGVPDEPQHELMGQVTGELFDTMRIPWESFPTSETEIHAALERADKYMRKEQRPYALVMSKGTVAPETLAPASPPSIRAKANARGERFKQSANRPGRQDVLKMIVAETSPKNDVILATTGFSGRELYAVQDRDNHFYMVGSMGCVSSLGLGLALARPDLRVVIVDGDGAALMRMGNFSTLGKYAESNLVHLLLDNEAHDSTGAQATVSAHTDFAEIASACGYRQITRAQTVEQVKQALLEQSTDGAKFIHAKIATGTIENLPRPKISPEAVYARLSKSINS